MPCLMFLIETSKRRQLEQRICSYRFSTGLLLFRHRNWLFSRGNRVWETQSTSPDTRYDTRQQTLPAEERIRDSINVDTTDMATTFDFIYTFFWLFPLYSSLNLGMCSRFQAGAVQIVSCCTQRLIDYGK